MGSSMTVYIYLQGTELLLRHERHAPYIPANLNSLCTGNLLKEQVSYFGDVWLAPRSMLVDMHTRQVELYTCKHTTHQLLKRKA